MKTVLLYGFKSSAGLVCPGVFKFQLVHLNSGAIALSLNALECKLLYKPDAFLLFLQYQLYYGKPATQQLLAFCVSFFNDKK